MLDDDRATYRAAIAEGFPNLSVDTLEYLSEGKDSVACLVNHRLVFRFPKQDRAEQKLLIETRLLPELAPTLPLAIPRFTYTVLTPLTSYPRAFVGYDLLDGPVLRKLSPAAIWDALG